MLNCSHHFVDRMPTPLAHAAVPGNDLDGVLYYKELVWGIDEFEGDHGFARALDSQQGRALLAELGIVSSVLFL